MISEIKKNLTNTVLVFCPNWVGDVVMATPVFKCLRQNYPDARIIGLIRGYARGVVEDAPWFDQLIEMNDKTWRGFVRLVFRIRRLKGQIAVVLPHTFRSALLARLGGARRIYGYRRNGRSTLITDGPRPLRDGGRIRPVPMVDYYLEICRRLQLTIDRDTKPRLFIARSLQERGNRLLARYGIGPDDMVIGLNPGAQYGASKCWPPEHFARLAELLEQRWNCRLLLFIGPGEESIGDEIVQLSRAAIINSGPDQVDLALLKPLIQRCRLLVTNDTGPRHYAVAFDIPVVVIMGPTDPRYTHANLEKTRVLRQELDCSPCHLKECPLEHSCMRDITPQDVLQAAEQLVQEKP
ncbi:MAG: lipopolysaccharide heptosyltransferase II [Deltaproteobacteria bacterium]|nr:lipopolysaccharide heptosyltransferase II [Deltaproteobacteria bacterium]